MFFLGRKTLCIYIYIYIYIYLSIYISIYIVFDPIVYYSEVAVFEGLYDIASDPLLCDLKGQDAAAAKYVSPAHLHAESCLGIACTGVGASMLLCI